MKDPCNALIDIYGFRRSNFQLRKIRVQWIDQIIVFNGDD